MAVLMQCCMCKCLAPRHFRGHVRAQVIPSRGVKIAGLLGPAAAIDRKSSIIADTPVGIGGTNQWKLAGLVRLQNPLFQMCTGL